MQFQCEYLVYSCLWFSNIYTCRVTRISKTSTTSQTKHFDGTHLRGKTNSDVKYVKVVDQSIDAFPRNLQVVFPNLKYLTIQGCGLSNVSREDLKGLENLEYLNLWFNKLTSLPDDLFTDMKKLLWIDFYENQLERLSSKLLQPIMSTLEFADFTGNVKVNDIFNINDKDKNDLKQLMRAIDSNCLQQKEQKDFFESAARNYYPPNEQLPAFSNFKAFSECTDFKFDISGKQFDAHENNPTPQYNKQKLFMDDDAKFLDAFKNIKNPGQKKLQSFLDYFNSDNIDTEITAMELFDVASKLKVKCTDKILANLNESNALEVFNLGHRHQSDELKQSAFKTIQNMFPEVPDVLINNPEHINKLVLLKRKFDAISAATRNLQLFPSN